MSAPKLKAAEPASHSGLRIGNIDYTSIAGIVFVQDDAAAFVITSPYFKPNPGLTAPDDSIHKLTDKGVLAVMTDPNKFWGDIVPPTVPRQDPAYKGQEYWHGTTWGPVNYLVFQGHEHVQLDNVPWAGKLHRVVVASGHTDISAK